MSMMNGDTGSALKEGVLYERRHKDCGEGEQQQYGAAAHFMTLSITNSEAVVPPPHAEVFW
jgi:hypothetical protein